MSIVMSAKMDFPYAAQFQELVSSGNLLILTINALVLGGFEALYLISKFKPALLVPTVWLGVGVFYALLVGMAILYFAGAATL